MRIAIIAKLYAPIRTTSSMGQEKFVYNLACLLAKKGHDVTLFAAPGSRVEGVKVISLIKESFWTEQNRKHKKEDDLNPVMNYCAGINEIEGYNKILFYLRKHKNDFDVIHDNSDKMAIIANAKFLVDLPLVSTLHVPPDYLHRLNKIIGEKELNNYYVSISKKQRKLAKNVKIFDVVYNGIDVTKFTFSAKSLSYLAWIGRVVPSKGLGAAMEIAEKTKTKLRIAGPIQNQQYFDKDIKPRLGKNIKYLGPLSGRKLIRFYKKAKALLFPIRWEEPFGLVMAEAMACGTPIIAFRRGSVPELVVQNKTGYICPRDKTASMIKAVKKIYALSDEKYLEIRKNCRQHVEAKFTLDKMEENYVEVYSKAILDWKQKKS